MKIVFYLSSLAVCSINKTVNLHAKSYINLLGNLKRKALPCLYTYNLLSVNDAFLRRFCNYTHGRWMESVFVYACNRRSEMDSKRLNYILV